MTFLCLPVVFAAVSIAVLLLCVALVIVRAIDRRHPGFAERFADAVFGPVNTDHLSQ